MSVTMRLAYIAGPYRAKDMRGVVLNIRRAEDVAVRVARLGYGFICPHMNSALLSGAITPHDGPDEEDYFLKLGLELVRRSDLLVVLPEWSQSKGTIAEMELALSLDKPVFLWPDVPQVRAFDDGKYGSLTMTAFARMVGHQAPKVPPAPLVLPKHWPPAETAPLPMVRATCVDCGAADPTFDFMRRCAPCYCRKRDEEDLKRAEVDAAKAAHQANVAMSTERHLEARTAAPPAPVPRTPTHYFCCVEPGCKKPVADGFSKNKCLDHAVRL